MGKTTGFMEYERHERSFRPIEERIKSYDEFYVPLDDEELSRQGARCMDCGIPFCHTGCPVDNIIPEWNDLIYKGHWRRALEVLHSTNNFPEFTGSIRAQEILDNWPAMLPKFVKVMPVDYRRALTEMKAQEEQGDVTLAAGE